MQDYLQFFKIVEKYSKLTVVFGSYYSRVQVFLGHCCRGIENWGLSIVASHFIHFSLFGRRVQYLSKVATRHPRCYITNSNRRHWHLVTFCFILAFQEQIILASKFVEGILVKVYIDNTTLFITKKPIPLSVRWPVEINIWK